MILICKHIKSYSVYARTQSPKSVVPIAININNIVHFVPISLWRESQEPVEITKMVLHAPISEENNEIIYLEHSFEEVRAMLFGMTLVHDYRVEHGTHFLRSEEYPLPQDDDDIPFS
jgi:hypothetical protein